MLVCYFFMPAPPAPLDNPNLPVNIDYVYGLSDKGPQTWMPPLAYFGLLMVGLPICVFLPMHPASAAFSARVRISIRNRAEIGRSETQNASLCRRCPCPIPRRGWR